LAAARSVRGVGRFGQPINNTAGWVQVNVHPPAAPAGGVGCGIDAPRERDIIDVSNNPNARLRNRSCAIYGIIRPAGPVFIGAEARRIETKYASGTFVNNHFNLAFGFEF